jgi:hypothetical protein
VFWRRTAWGRDRFVQPDSAFLSLLTATLGACVERDARRAELRRLAADHEAERDLLMQEVHHRVKNSLQLVTTLLMIQARGSDEPTVHEQLQAGSWPRPSCAASPSGGPDTAGRLARRSPALPLCSHPWQGTTTARGR